LSELKGFAQVDGLSVLDRYVTLPYTDEMQAECDLVYLDGELEAKLFFIYDGVRIPAESSGLKADDFLSFIKKEGIVARNLTEERKIVQELFDDFAYDAKQGVYVTKIGKKIVEFMTEIVPKNQHRVTFHCPENLLSQFIYDDTTFKLCLRESNKVDLYEVDLCVKGPLKGVTLDLLWECLASRRSFIELSEKKKKKRKSTSLPKILVLDLEKVSPVVQIFDEIGITKLDDHVALRPLWSLASVHKKQFKGLPITFSITPKLCEIQAQILGQVPFEPVVMPDEIQTSVRQYQIEGVTWLDRLQKMHLNGILADDMGLGKTLQAIVAITRYRQDGGKNPSIVVCPTSLVYNWQEEFHKFNPKLRVLPIDGVPLHRKECIASANEYDVIITSYTLLQKDVEEHEKIDFAYVILDEAQHIKNRLTRNAKSVKRLKSAHRLILTGTPIENSLLDIWSLFDFLMPGLLSSFERFNEKYVRNPNHAKNRDVLRQKLTPFILRRVKQDVLKELPPVSELTYHCHLTDTQRELYHSYALSAKEELSALVKKEGFDRVKIHVLATLTRLKQICCHPAIFAKEYPERGDSAKYEMLLELLQTLIEGGHKTVIFSQYTRMLKIMRHDFENKGIRFEYLDGATKNRLSVVKRFNSDPSISVFLVSLKAGGTGLNLVGADTAIHYDMWWNPAVQMQATGRLHRCGQENPVSDIKLVTLNTIEEYILNLQNQKKGVAQQVIATDEEAISKLIGGWDQVLELLQLQV